jgi:hypothetical protein
MGGYQEGISMNAETISLMSLFFEMYCGTRGEIPQCAGCEHYVKDRGCSHSQNPINIYMAQAFTRVSEIATPRRKEHE